MRMILSRRVLLALLAVVTSGACGGTGQADVPLDDPSPVVLATTSIWADIASNGLCRRVPSIIPMGADPHTFEPSLRDRELIEDAEVIIANGGGLEGGIADLLAASNATVIELADDGRLDLIDGDPHIWQSTRAVGGALDLIESAVRPLGLPACSNDYRMQLNMLDMDIIGLMQQVPEQNRLLVTSHDSLAYFAERYGLEVVGTVIPSTNTLAQTNAADLAALAELIDERSIPAIFTEQLESSADADALAARLGVRVVPLVTDALTAETDTYLEMMRSNATLIAEALTP